MGYVEFFKINEGGKPAYGKEAVGLNGKNL